MSVLLDLAGLIVVSVLALGFALALWLPERLTIGERVVAGIVLAVVGLDLAGYLIALAVGVNAGLVAVLSALALGLAGALVAVGRARLVRFAPTAPRPLLRALRRALWAGGHDPSIAPGTTGASGRGHGSGLHRPSPPSWPVLAIVCVLALALALLYGHAIEITPQGWLAHYTATWSDWAFHASDTTTFVYGRNLPPQNPVYAGTPLRYPFFPDFASAILVAGGWGIPAALAWPSWAMALLALSGVILWARRLSGRLLTGVIAVTLMLLGGGLGFVAFFGDVAKLGLGRLSQLPHGYDRFDPPVNIQWYNPILSYYLPQRSFVFGAAIVVAVFLLLTPTLQAAGLWQWRSTLQSLAALRNRVQVTSDAAVFVAAGVLCGLLPWFHVHSLLVIGLVSALWAIIFPRPAWIGFFAALLLLSVPRLLMAVPGDGSMASQYHYPRLIAGWMSNGDNPVWFWIKNTGTFWPLLLVALLTPLGLNRRARLILAPFFVVFVVANLVAFQPWEWDNSKLLVFWYLAGAVAVSALLIRVIRLGLLGWIAAGAVWLSLVAAGGLSLGEAVLGTHYTWFTPEEMQLAAQVRSSTSPHAIFLTGAWVTDPVADLAGRTVVMSYRGWLWSYGIDYTARQADVGEIFAGGPRADDLLHRYHVDYVVIDPTAVTSWHANVAYFAARFPLVLHTDNYQVYRVPRG